MMKRFNLSLFCLFFGLCFFAINVSAQTDKPIRGGVLNGKSISLPIPEYPPAARAIRASGTVNVEVTISEEGKVISATAVSGHPLLQLSAEKAATAAKFSPTRLEGKPVKVTGIIVYNFASGETKTDAVNQKDKIEEALNGQAKKLPSPEYPSAAKAVRASGKVKVKVTLDEKGNVISTTVISGHPLLRASAEKAAKGTKFDPADIKNKSVKMDGILVYVFFALPKEKKINDKR